MNIASAIAPKKMAKRLTMLVFALGVAEASPAVAQSEIPASLNGIAIHLPMPAGYCSLDTNNPAEAQIYDATTKALAAAGNRLLGLAVVCDQLAAFRASGQHFSHFMEFMATLNNAAPIRVEDSRRAQYFSELSASVPKLDMKTIADSANQATQTAGVSTKVSQFGVLAQDDTALYIGAIATYNNSAPLADVLALTTAGKWAIGAAFYQDFVGSGTMTSLLEEAKGEARAMIAANASNPNPPAELSQQK